MKLFNRFNELKAIRTITTSEEGVASLLLSSIDPSFFHFKPCAAAYDRIMSQSKKRGKILTFSDLVEDMSLNEDYREILKDSKPVYCKTTESAEKLVAALGDYRKARILLSVVDDVHTTLKGTEVDIESLLDRTTNSLAQARMGDSLAQLVRIIGRDGNALDLVNQALDMTDDILYKTGFEEFDQKSGGLPSEGVFIMAGTTSGGKSAVLMNMMEAMYKINKIDVCNVSLEMNDKKQTRRILSKLTQIPFEKFHKKKLSRDERKQARVAWKRLHRYGVENGCRFSMINPTHAVTIQQILMLLKPYQFKVIGIDYISLLDVSGEKDQWKALSEIARQCKIFSTANHCLIILLAQLDSDDDHIRYSKGLLEHADNCWTWNYSKPEQRDMKIIPVRQLKARDQDIYNFDLVEAFEVMTVSGVARDSMEDLAKSVSVDPDEHPDIDYEESGTA